MKAIIIYSIILFTGLQGPSFNTSLESISQPIEIIYGRGFHCTGKGICNITTAEFSTPNSTQLIFDDDGQPLYIEVSKSSLTEEETMLHFSDRFIQIDKKFELSQSRSLKQEPLVINPGKYLIQVDRTSYRIMISTN